MTDGRRTLSGPTMSGVGQVLSFATDRFRTR